MTAHAEWKYEITDDTSKGYIDYSRIKTEGPYKSIWILYDYKPPLLNYLGKQYKSVASKRMIDCQASKQLAVAIYYFSEQMGKGNVVDSVNYQINESNWKIAPPNSFNEKFIDVACATNNNSKPPVNNTQDNKRQKCISLGLAPGSADFQQCIN